MDPTSPAVAYIILLIPTLTALVVTGQGAYKLMRHEAGGSVIFGFGVSFLLCITAAYFLFIR